MKIKLQPATIADMKNIKPSKKTTTSEKYREDVRIFLEEMKIFSIKSKKIIKMIIKTFDDLKLPIPGEQLRIRTQQQVNLIVLVLRILKQHDKIDELTIATYSLNKEAFNILSDLVKAGKIKKFNIFLASSNRFRNENHLNYLINLSRELSESGFLLSFVLVWSHFKITLARCGSDFYQFEGSMNYSMNNMAEQIVFENNKDLYDFDYDFITETMQDTKNKALEIII